MPRRRTFRWLCKVSLSPLLGWVVTACSTALGPPPPAAPPPEPLTASEIAAFSALLELEDRHDLFMPLIEQSASAAEASVRQRTALAVGRIGDAAGRAIVRQLLLDPDTGVAATAVFAAGLLRDTSSVDVLTSFIAAPRADAAPTVAAEAAWALGQIGDAAARRSLLGYLTAADTIRSTGAQQEVLRRALAAAIAADAADAADLVRWSGSPDPRIRQLAAEGLARNPSPDGTRRLRTLLSAASPAVRAAALGGLSASRAQAAGISEADLLPDMVALLGDTAYVVRIAAIEATSTYPSESAVAHLLQVAAEGDPHERVAAVRGLGSIGSPAAGALDPLASLARDRSEADYLRAVALLAVSAIDQSFTESLVDELAGDPSWRLRANAAEVLARLGPSRLPALQRLARDVDPRVARAGIAAAARRGDREEIDRLRPLLLEAALHPEVGVRAEALSGLARLADLALFPVLLDAYEAALNDVQNDAQLAAIDAIAALRGSGLAAPERAFFARFPRSDDYRVRLRAVERFGEVALRRWGEAFPLEPSGTLRPYRVLVERWVAPADRDLRRPRVSIQTEEGEVVVELFSDQATLTTSNLLLLASTGFFDGREIAAVVPGSVLEISGGHGDMAGGAGYSVRPELSRITAPAGTAGSGLAGPLASSGDVFITLDLNRELYGQVGLVGRVLEGQDVLQRLLPGQRILSFREIEEEE